MGIFWRIFLAFQELKDGKKNPDISQIQIQPHVGSFMKNL